MTSEPSNTKSTEPSTASEQVASPSARRAAGSFPRMLALGWATWLLASALVTLFIHQPMHPDTRFFNAAVRTIMVLIIVGLTWLWPMIRLCQATRRGGRWGLLVDLLWLYCFLQVVLWPMRLTTRWPVSAVLVVDAAILAWGLLVMSITALGMVSQQPVTRALAMTACIATTLLGPLAGAVGSYLRLDVPESLVDASPFTVLVRSGRPDTLTMPAGFVETVSIVLTAALVVWVTAGMAERRSRRAADSMKEAGC